MEEKNAQNSLHFFFRCGGVSMIILSIKVGIINILSVRVITSLWYTFLYIFIEAIWLGLAGMFIIDLYKYIKSKIL